MQRRSMLAHYFATRDILFLTLTRLLKGQTREEREEAYNKARERIFGTSEKTGETTPGKDNAAKLWSIDATNV